MADVRAAVAHRRALEGPRERPRGRDAERADVAREVGEPQWPGQLAEVPDQADAVGPGRKLALFLGREAGEHGVLRRPRLVDGGDDAVAGPGEPAGALDDLGEHGVEVERGVDAQDGRAQGGIALAQGLDLLPCITGLRQGSSSAGSLRTALSRAGTGRFRSLDVPGGASIADYYGKHTILPTMNTHILYAIC